MQEITVKTRKSNNQVKFNIVYIIPRSELPKTVMGLLFINFKSDFVKVPESNFVGVVCFILHPWEPFWPVVPAIFDILVSGLIN